MKNTGSLRRVLKEKRFMRIVGAHNGMTARLVEQNGFEGVWASGLEISTSHAVPDANILTMTDFLEASGEMVDSVSVPVISDCDTGFGNSNNVIHLVKKFESAGVSAVCIEDKLFPKVNSFIPGRQELAPVAEFVGKIMAAKNARVTEDFLVFARIEALVSGWGMDEALKRADAYAEAGADGIFIHSKSKAPDEIATFCKKWKKQALLVICPTTYPSLNEKDMRKLGVDIVVYANHGIRASIKAVNETLGYIRQHGIVSVDPKIAPLSEVFELQGMHIMKKNEEKYLKTKVGGVKAIIPAAGSKIDASLKGLLEDRPLAMLDINGKTLIQRNIETLNNTGIRDINVVVGYKKEKLEVEGAKTVENPDYKTKGLIHSVLKGAGEPADKNIVAYSDIIFDHELIEKLVGRDDDIVIVVDSTYKKTHLRNKKLELVVTERPVSDNMRTINTGRNNRVLKIGRDLPESESHSEFVGLACFSKRGLSVLLNEYQKAGKKAKRPSGKQAGVENLSFADFIQYIIDKGHSVSAYNVTGGWMEIHNFEDYKKACSVF